MSRAWQNYNVTKKLTTSFIFQWRWIRGREKELLFLLSPRNSPSLPERARSGLCSRVVVADLSPVIGGLMSVTRGSEVREGESEASKKQQHYACRSRGSKWCHFMLKIAKRSIETDGENITRAEPIHVLWGRLSLTLFSCRRPAQAENGWSSNYQKWRQLPADTILLTVHPITTAAERWLSLLCCCVGTWKGH